jgi:hypothetical protein
MTEYAVKDFRRVPFFGHLSWARKKGDKQKEMYGAYWVTDEFKYIGNKSTSGLKSI